ncbi:MAG TPA: PAS domain-containing protein [Myxococcus sp.]|nr:PAS domain-containing protein [Myxococcus sp.]
MPSPLQFALGITLVPPDSPAREPLAFSAARSGLRVVDGLEEASLVLVDLTHPGIGPVIPALLDSPRANDFTIVALVEPGERGIASSEPLRPVDVLTVPVTPHELAWRLQRAAERHLERQEQARGQEDLALLLELTADYAETSDVEVLLHGVTRRLAEKLDIARATLVMLGRNNDEGVVIATSDDPALKNLRIELSRYPEIREVMRTGRPVVMQEVSTHPLLGDVERKAVAARGIHSIAALPLPIRGQVRGVLLVRAGGRRRGFNSREVDFLTTVAHATAVALRNASVLQSVRGQTEAEKTARLAAEEQAASFKPYQLFFAHVSEGVAILDEDAGVLSLNPSGASMLDIPASDARGKHLHHITQPVDESVLMELVTAASQGEARSGVDVEVRTIANRRLTLSMSAAPLRDEDAATILSFRDVTNARRLENELRQTKDFLERLIDSSVDGIIAADLKGRIILFNKGAEALCGYSAQEALAGLTVHQLYPPGIPQRIMTMLRSQEHGGKGRLSLIRQELVHRSGELVPVNMTASLVYEGGREAFSVGIFTDMRDRMQLERKLSDVETRLEESEKSAVIVALAGTAAHELNQPLTSVMGYAELLKRKLKEEDFAWKPVDIIYREAERMAEIGRKIGKITRYETKSYMGAQRILDLDKASSHED